MLAFGLELKTELGLAVWEAAQMQAEAQAELVLQAVTGVGSREQQLEVAVGAVSKYDRRPSLSSEVCSVSLLALL